MGKLRALGVHAIEVRKAEQLEALQGLIIPGGESTAMGLIARRWGLVAPLQAWVRADRPVWGTCAGMILLSDRAVGQKQEGQPLLGGLDVLVSRNYFGSQRHSFETSLDVQGWPEPAPAVFIRAPALLETGPAVTRLAEFTATDGQCVAVAVRQAHILATAFHPELTGDLRWHRLFLDMVHTASG